MTQDPSAQDRDDLAERLRAVGPLPRGLPPGGRARLDALAAAGSPVARTGERWRAPGAGLAAGLVLSLSILAARAPHGDRTVAWTRADPGETWTPAASGERLEGARAGREVRLSDGSTVDLAPGCRLVLEGRRPGKVARIETGEALFSVVPGAGSFAVDVPEGRIEVVGTAFGIAVRADAREGGMITQRDWIVGSATAIVTVAVTSGLVHYMDSGIGKATPVAAGERLEVDRDGARRLEQAAQRERALALRERTVEERERLLREAEQVAASREAIAADSSATVETPALPAELAEEERARAEVLDAVQQLVAGMRPMMEIEHATGDTLTPEQEQQMLSAAGGTMAAYSRIFLQRERLHGELGATVAVALLDGMMPPDANLSDSQRERIRQLYADSERRLESLGVPKHRLLPFHGFSDPHAGLEPWQVEGMAEIYRDAESTMSAFLTPQQYERVEGLGQSEAGR
ncbi:MAG: FecR domain-containing protein [Planctomycetes bacterium]|nr:FecR domain-containing protein [Planctomycetota bacterium]